MGGGGGSIGIEREISLKGNITFLYMINTCLELSAKSKLNVDTECNERLSISEKRCADEWDESQQC